MLNITKSMELSNMIKESEWFCAIEGIAIAEKIYNIYEGVSKVKPARPEGTEVHSPGQAKRRPGLWRSLGFQPA